MIGHLLGFATAYLMPLILTLSCGKTGAGIWAACISIVGIASMFMTGLASYWLPRTANAFCQGGPDTLRRMMRNAGIIYATALGLFALFVFATGDFLLVLAYGQKFAGNGPVIGVLAFNVFITSLSLTVGMGLWAINRPDGNLPADACCLVVTLAVAACLIPTWGVLGAAVGDTVGKLAGLLARQWTFRQLIDGAAIPAAAH
jgi:O-antigen/teichoic acid export membrane protein